MLEIEYRCEVQHGQCVSTQEIMGVGVLTCVGKCRCVLALTRQQQTNCSKVDVALPSHSKQQCVRAHVPVCMYAYVVSADACASDAKLTNGDGRGETAATAK